MGEDERLIFFAGDVMTGRQVDEQISRTDPCYIWGDALAELDRWAPEVRIVNLETSVTTSADAWPDKRFNFRMHPNNTPCLNAARFDCCILANNHVLDFGYDGLAETIDSLRCHGIESAGAGDDLAAASAPAVLPMPGGGRALVFALTHPSSFTPRAWAAESSRPGVNLLGDYSAAAVESIRRQAEAIRRPFDTVIVSLHWGGNWGYEVRKRQRWFAHRLIQLAGVDVVHGHSSHHPLAVEIYRRRPIIYGSGDLINDYRITDESAPYRPELSALYFLRQQRSTGVLTGMTLVPMRIGDRRLHRATRAEASWLRDALNRGGFPVPLIRKLKRWRDSKRASFGLLWKLTPDATLTLRLK